jgi:hypothetical protein
VLHARAEKKPIGAGAPLVGQADRTGVEHPPGPELTIELHVGVPTHDDGLIDSLERSAPPALGRQRSERFLVVAGRSVAEEGRTEAVDVEHDPVDE